MAGKTLVLLTFAVVKDEIMSLKGVPKRRKVSKMVEGILKRCLKWL